MDLFNKKRVKRLENQLRYTEEQFERLNGELATYKNLYKEDDVSKNNLIKENQKLIDWIEKIINEVGVKTNCKDSSINIPYYEDIHYEENRIAGNYEKDYFPKQQRKDIIIPSIRFTKFI